MNIRNHNNKIIVPKELKLKNLQKEIRNPITPKCQLKWDTYEKKFNWMSIWYILNKIKCKQSIIQFQWKCLHNIVYSEYRLQKMGKENFPNSERTIHFCLWEIPCYYFPLYFSKKRVYTSEGYRKLAFLSIDDKRDLIGCLR